MWDFVIGVLCLLAVGTNAHFISKDETFSSASPSPSPSQSNFPTAIYQLAFSELNGACSSSANCITSAADDYLTVRFGIYIERSYVLAVQPSCTSQGGKVWVC
eukprot:c3458_g1_i1.p1 GENE.c3458_g1_i1~~c3458_g1_i1.p1  ORF type:complete len:120 (-),score=16.39 c3458_g1_i1:256-564(-)